MARTEEEDAVSKRPSIASLAPKKAAAPTEAAQKPAEVSQHSAPNHYQAKSRPEAGYKAILSKVDEATHRQMKILAANEGVPIGDLQIEAINLLFRSRGLPEIAERVTPDETGRKR